MLKVIYALFFGLLLATFVGVGIDTFYRQPLAPEPPVSFERKAAPTDADLKEETAFREVQKAFEAKISVYNRNLSMIVLAFAVLFLVVGLAFATRLDILADGFLFGGVFSLLYSIGRGLAAQDPTYRFLVVTIGLIVVGLLGYFKFARAKLTDRPT